MRPMPMFALANGLSSGVTSVDCTQGELNCSRVTPASPVVGGKEKRDPCGRLERDPPG